MAGFVKVYACQGLSNRYNLTGGEELMRSAQVNLGNVESLSLDQMLEAWGYHVICCLYVGTGGTGIFLCLTFLLASGLLNVQPRAAATVH